MTILSSSPLRRLLLLGAILVSTLAALGGFAAPRASAVSDSEELFSILLGQGEAAGEARTFTSAASDPATSHLYFSEPEQARIDEYTPWGGFVKAIGWDVAPGPVNEQQEIRIKAAEGQFRLSFEGATTSDIPLAVGAKGPVAAEAIENALEGLSTIGGAGGSVSVIASQGTPDGFTPYIYVVAFKGSLAGQDLDQMTLEPGADPLSGGQPSTAAEVRTRANGGPATTGLEVCTAESGCQAGLQGDGAGQFGAARGLAFAGGNLYVQESRYSGGADYRVQEISPEGRFIRMFGGDVISDGASGTGDLAAGSATVSGVVTTSRFFEVGQQVTGAGIDAGTTIVAVGSGTLTLSKAATSSGNGVSIEAPEGTGNVPANAKQTISMGKAASGAAPTGGSFTVTFATPDPSPSKDTTAAIPFGATAAEFEARLAELSNLDAADVAVTGPAGGPWTVEFVGPRFGDSAPPLLNVSTKELQPPLPFASESYGYDISTESSPEICIDAPSCRRGVQGMGPGEFSGGPHYRDIFGGYEPGYGLAATPTGIAVADHGRIQRFGLDGAFQNLLPTPGRIPVALAATPGGNFWAYFSAEPPDEPVRAAIGLDGATGAQLAEVPLGQNQSNLATDQAGNLYLGWAPAGSFVAERVKQLDSSLQPLSPESCCQAPLSDPADLFYFRLVAMATNPVGDLLVVYTGKSGAFGPPNLIKLFGPGPVQFEAPPAAPPTIASQFASSVQANEATVSGFVNPRFWTDTKVYVEYGTGSCAAGECTTTRPMPPGGFLTDKATSSMTKVPGIILEDLEPNTVYHYRLVAASSGGGPVAGIGGTEGSAGEESTFTTAAPQSEPQAGCPNAAVKTGFSSPLPDCRAYEMVSPVNKDGGDIKTLPNAFVYSNAVDQSAAGGGAFTFSSYRSFGQPDGAAMTNQYLSTRVDGSGWRSSAITPSQALNSSGKGYSLINWDNMFRAFSPDLCSAWVFVGTEPALDEAIADPKLPVLYRRENCAGSGDYEALAQGEAIEPGKKNPFSGGEVELQGVSADGTTVLVRSNNNLIPDAGGGGKARAYYISGGQTSLVCILPNGTRHEGDCAAGNAANIEGIVGVGEGNRVGALTHAMSADGSRVYWTAILENAEYDGKGTIYLRQNPGAEQSASGGCEEAEKACTIAVSGTKSAAAARFRAASADGSRAVYEFADGSLAGNLYQFDADTGTSSLVAKKTLGYVAGADDLSIYYFVSEEKLAGTEGAQKGEPNLYVVQEGTPTFIATLSRLDANSNPRRLSNVSPQAVFHIARATPDGRTLAFLSTNSLTGYDNTDASSPLPCGVSEGTKEGMCAAEVYLYRVGSEAPVCVSCNPTGAQPEGRNGLKVGDFFVPYTVSGTLTAPTTQLYTPRNLSVDGTRLFFDSFSSLLPRDTNGKRDVYEWSAAAGAGECEAMGAERYVASSQGCLSLISSGESSSDSEFRDADESGANAFFTTNASLLPQDPGLYDVYDARVEGGFPQPEVVAACEGEACQGPFNPPTDPTPASSSFNGPGNFQPKSPAKKKHKKHKKKQQKKKHKKKQKAGRDSSKANRDGRNG